MAVEGRRVRAGGGKGTPPRGPWWSWGRFSHNLGLPEIFRMARRVPAPVTFFPSISPRYLSSPGDPCHD